MIINIPYVKDKADIIKCNNVELFSSFAEKSKLHLDNIITSEFSFRNNKVVVPLTEALHAIDPRQKGNFRDLSVVGFIPMLSVFRDILPSVFIKQLLIRNKNGRTIIATQHTRFPDIMTFFRISALYYMLLNPKQEFFRGIVPGVNTIEELYVGLAAASLSFKRIILEHMNFVKELSVREYVARRLSQEVAEIRQIFTADYSRSFQSYVRAQFTAQNLPVIPTVNREFSFIGTQAMIKSVCAIPYAADLKEYDNTVGFTDAYLPCSVEDIKLNAFADRVKQADFQDALLEAEFSVVMDAKMKENIKNGLYILSRW